VLALISDSNARAETSGSQPSSASLGIPVDRGGYVLKVGGVTDRSAWSPSTAYEFARNTEPSWSRERAIDSSPRSAASHTAIMSLQSPIASNQDL